MQTLTQKTKDEAQNSELPGSDAQAAGQLGPHIAQQGSQISHKNRCLESCTVVCSSQFICPGKISLRSPNLNSVSNWKKQTSLRPYFLFFLFSRITFPSPSSFHSQGSVWSREPATTPFSAAFIFHNINEKAEHTGNSPRV